MKLIGRIILLGAGLVVIKIIKDTRPNEHQRQKNMNANKTFYGHH